MSDKQWHGHYPEPLREAPEVGTECWIVDISYEIFGWSWYWDGSVWDLMVLQRGRLHLTREAAAAHARFEIEQAGGVV